MRSKSIISLIVLISILVLVITSQGCSDSNDTVVMDMAKMMPEGMEFAFIDVGAIRGDDDLENVYKDVESSWVYLLDKLGIGIDDVNRIAWVGNLALFDADFDLDDVRETLDENGYNNDEYNDVEIWERGLDHGMYALMDNYIIFGFEENFNNCIDVIKEEEDSILDNPGFKDMMDMLPDGLAMHYSGYTEYTDQEASGISIQKLNNDTIKTTALFQFQDKDAAEDAVDDIKNNGEDAGLNIVSINQKNEYVESITEIDIDDFYL